MTQSLPSLDSLFQSIVLATLAIGLPIFFVFAIRFLWDRNLRISRSKDLEKLIWQLHRIATALEHQLSLPSTPIQPGTEEPRDLIYLQQPPTQPTAATPAVAAPQVMAPSASTGATPTLAPAQPPVQQTTAPPPAAQQPSSPALEPRDPSSKAQRAGVNSMFGM